MFSIHFLWLPQSACQSGAQVLDLVTFNRIDILNKNVIALLHVHRSGFISIKGKRNLKLHVLFTRPVGVKPGITSSLLHLFLTARTFSIVLLLCFVSATTKKRFDQNSFKSF